MFKFKDLELVFEYKTFIIDDPAELARKIAEKAGTLNDDIESGILFVDYLLEPGATEHILNGRIPTVQRISEIIEYIMKKLEDKVNEISKHN